MSAVMASFCGHPLNNTHPHVFSAPLLCVSLPLIYPWQRRQGASPYSQMMRYKHSGEEIMTFANWFCGSFTRVACLAPVSFLYSFKSGSLHSPFLLRSETLYSIVLLTPASMWILSYSTFHFGTSDHSSYPAPSFWQPIVVIS